MIISIIAIFSILSFRYSCHLKALYTSCTSHSAIPMAQAHIPALKPMNRYMMMPMNISIIPDAFISLRYFFIFYSFSVFFSASSFLPLFFLVRCDYIAAFLLFYSLFFVSIQIVTGPSFNSSTFISAPNSPVPTCLPIASESCEQKAS